jgi:hypothetical protein
MLVDHPHVKSASIMLELTADRRRRTILVIDTDIAISNLELGFDETKFNSLMDALTEVLRSLKLDQASIRRGGQYIGPNHGKAPPFEGEIDTMEA